MAAARLRRVDGARNREDVAPAFQRHARGDQRARLDGGLHHQRAAGDAGDQAVAAREIEGERVRAQRVFAGDQALLGNAASKAGMPGRIDAIQAGADESDRAARAGQAAVVGRAVDAHGQAGNNGQPALTQKTSEFTRVVHALRGRAPAAHDGDARRRQQLDPAQREQQQRRVGRLQQQNGVARIAQYDDVARRVARCGFEPALRGG